MDSDEELNIYSALVYDDGFPRIFGFPYKRIQIKDYYIRESVHCRTLDPNTSWQVRPFQLGYPAPTSGGKQVANSIIEHLSLSEEEHIARDVNLLTEHFNKPYKYCKRWEIYREIQEDEQRFISRYGTIYKDHN